MMQKIRFQDDEYILIDGAIITPERYRSGTVSLAHLYDDGTIRRYRVTIATRGDIDFLCEIEDVKPTMERLLNLLRGWSWS